MGKESVDPGAWARQNPRRRMSVYFQSEEQRATLEQASDSRGYKKFSKFIVDMAELGASGKVTDEAELEAMRDRLVELEDRWRKERDLAQEFMAENQRLHEVVEKQQENNEARFREILHEFQQQFEQRTETLVKKLGHA